MGGVAGAEAVGAGHRYRPGRGGYDPEAAELAARARYTFRRRMVLGLVLLAVTTAVVPAGLGLPEVWWVHAAADAALLVYLVDLRRQVRSEQQIRARRAARLAGSRRARPIPDQLRPDPSVSDRSVSDRPAPDQAAPDRSVADQRRDGEVPARGAGQPRVIERRRRAGRRADPPPGPAVADEQGAAEPVPETDTVEAPDAASVELLVDAFVEVEEDQRSALPLLAAAPLPPHPAGTEPLELDDEDPELHYLDGYQEQWGYRRAAGQ